jgi:hypothetical protein
MVTLTVGGGLWYLGRSLFDAASSTQCGLGSDDVLDLVSKNFRPFMVNSCPAGEDSL